ncbi:MAG: hypothetical protein H6Q57_1856 [Geobacteraceae bacterium]|nr:hypothetical protein [Geobacteraceae bacterium]
MNKIAMLMLAGFSMLCSSCGGEVAIVINIPGISLIYYSPDSAVPGQGAGAATSAVTLDFYAPDADISTLTVSVVDSRGFPVTKTVMPLSGYSGAESGTIAFSIDFSTAVIETYTFSVFITDNRGYVSNTVFGTFRVIG